MDTCAAPCSIMMKTLKAEASNSTACLEHVGLKYSLRLKIFVLNLSKYEGRREYIMPQI